MKQAFSLYSVLFLFLGMNTAFNTPLMAQEQEDQGIKTDNRYSAETLVRDIFVKGSCDNVSNIQVIGNPAGVGYFENGDNVIGIENGIILATGDIKGAHGPNEDRRRTGNFQDSSGDKDLRSLVTSDVSDAVGIEFDFIPLDSFVAFRYVFASEEYCEFVGKDFNDAFGFFVSGPGISGTFSNQSKNVALIPDTDDYVTINSVNHNTNSDYFIGNFREDDANACGINFEDKPSLRLIEYDGFTVVLEASLALIPCETYHIRFVVGDVEDSLYDSAVFLEAGSFNLGGEVQLSTIDQVENEPYIIEEGCEKGFFLFERADINNTNFPLTVRFKPSDASTAIEGLDYDTIPRTITIPEGQISTILPVTVFNDRLIESPEMLQLELDIPCACYTGAAEMEFHDSPRFVISLPDQTVCEDEPADLTPFPSGGTAPFDYQWEDGTTNRVRTVSLKGPQDYFLTVTDACDNEVVEQVNIAVKPPPTATIFGTSEICEGDTATMTVAFTGLPPYEITISRNAAIHQTYRNIKTNTFQFSVKQAGSYEIAFFGDSLCIGETEGAGEVAVKGFQAEWAVKDVTCPGGNDGEIDVTVEGGQPPYQFTWNSPVNSNESRVAGLSAGSYSFNLMDNQGCDRNFTVDITEPTPIQNVSFRCEDLSRGFVWIEASGGNPPFSYSIDGQEFMDNTLFQTLEYGQSYQLYIMDSQGCIQEQSFIMPAPFTTIAQLPAQHKIDVGLPLDLSPQLLIPENLVAKTEWFPKSNLSCSDCLSPTIQPLNNELYTLKVEDIFGCTGTVSTTIKVKNNIKLYIPNAFSPNGDGKNDRLTIFGNNRQITQIKSLEIFDRWGNQIFSRNSFSPNQPDLGWDGKLNNRNAPNGIYVVLVEVEFVNNTTQTIQSQVLLMR